MTTDIFSADPPSGGRFPLPLKIVVNLPVAHDIALEWDRKSSPTSGLLGGDLLIRRTNSLDSPRTILTSPDTLSGFGVLPGVSVYEISPKDAGVFSAVDVQARLTNPGELGDVSLSLQTWWGFKDHPIGPRYTGAIVTMPKASGISIVAQSNVSQLYIFAR